MKLLVTGAVQWDREQLKEIENLGHEIIYIQNEKIPLKKQGIDTEIIEGTICNSLFLYNEIEEFKNLNYIQLTSAGYDRVPLNYINEHNIKIYNAKNVYSIPMAEFAVAGILQIYKKSLFFYKNSKEHRWEKNRDLLELFNKKVCIIGCGNVGNECAIRFRSFGCYIIGIDLSTRIDNNYDSFKCINELNDVLPKCDIVILTLPLTEKTYHLMNFERLSILKKRSILVNLARGELLDENALIKISSSLEGVVLDVFEEEPLKANSPLWEMENVIITPHNSFVGDGNKNRLQRLIVNNLDMYTI